MSIVDVALQESNDKVHWTDTGARVRVEVAGRSAVMGNARGPFVRVKCAALHGGEARVRWRIPGR